MTKTEHPIDAIQDALDGRLDPSVRASLDAHLGICDVCRGEYERLAWTKRQLASLREETSMPASLPAQIQEALDAEDSRLAAGPAIARGRRWWWRPRWRLAVAAAALFVGWLTWPSAPRVDSLPRLVAADYRAFTSGALPLGLEATRVEEVEAYFRRSELPFPTRVFDLGMMRYQVIGGLVHQLNSRQSALFAYHGPGGHQIICAMFRGRVEDLPTAQGRLRNGGIEFLVYHEGSVTVVFWQEGDVVCVLAGDGESRAVIELAFAKAMKV